jgi:hypothetical protein
VRRLVAVSVLGGLILSVAALGGGTGTHAVNAQQPTPTPTATPTAAPLLPARFQGTVMMFGKKPSGSLTVTAYVGSAACGTGTVKSGVYSVNVKAQQDAAGCGTSSSTVWFKLGDYWANEIGSWTGGQPQSLNLTGPKMKTDALAAGCSNQMTVTFANKTPTKTLRAAVEPATELLAMWKWNAKTAQWDGDFPGAPDSVNTLKTLDRLDIIWVCTSNGGNLVQPALDFQ